MRIGSCFCELNTIDNERRKINTNGEVDQKSGGTDDSSDRPISKPEGSLSWDARDLEKNAWIPRSSKQTEGRDKGRFWQEE